MKVRDRVPRGLGWWSRAWLSAVLAWAVVAVLAVLPLGAGTVQQARASASARTVDGPAVWIPDLGQNPNDGGYGETGHSGPTGRITVSQTKDLVDQVIHVSWTGFTPTTDIVGNSVTSAAQGGSDTYYGVRVYQCRGENPGPTDCYGDSLYGGDPGKGFQQLPRQGGLSAPEFPSNMQFAATGADGSGQADIEVWSAAQSQTLGCDATHPCSVVVVPNYGGDAIDVNTFVDGNTSGAPYCDDHTFDRDTFFHEAADHIYNLPNEVNQNWTGGACAWSHHTAIRLDFAPTAADCPPAAADFKIAGLEMANRALQQWRAGLCAGTNPLNVDYTSTGGEPQARAAFLHTSGADVALTARVDSGPAPRPYVYAPLANSAISVVFVVDDPASGRQIRQLRLNARLMAKELTQSYSGTPPASMDNAPASVKGNPTCLFADPEFLALNPPSLIAPAQWPGCSLSAPSLPIVVGGTTDLVYQLTSWIAADPQAAAFLQGAPDDWGMHLDTFYLRSAFAGYPVDSFTVQDRSSAGQAPNVIDNWKGYEWIPLIGGLEQVARHLLAATASCQDPTLIDGKHAACAPQPTGTRTLIAVLDAGEAEALSLPEAQLLNPAGAFVAPSVTSMQAAVADMPTDPVTGTQALPYGAAGSTFAKDTAAYPLTTVQYAMVPTAGQSTAKAGAISRFVQQVTDLGSGQLYGPEPGRLALGYGDLTAGQQAMAQAAVQHVLAQDGTLPGNQVAPTQTSPAGPATTPAPAVAGTPAAVGAVGAVSGTNPDTTGAGSGANAAAGTGIQPQAVARTSASPSASRSAGASGPSSLAPVAAGQPAPARAGVARMLLPVVLITGAVLLVGGPAALVLGGTAAGGRVLTRLRRLIGSGG